MLQKNHKALIELKPP